MSRLCDACLVEDGKGYVKHKVDNLELCDMHKEQYDKLFPELKNLKLGNGFPCSKPGVSLLNE